MRSIVKATNLSRFYGIVLGLNNVSFEIAPGITGLVGPNGAGKTTLFRLLTGQIKASSGELQVFGGSPYHDLNVRAQIAYCPEDEAVPAGIWPREWLKALGMISGLSGREAERRAGESLERVQLPSLHWRKPVSALSKGMKQRVKLAQCLLHEPRLIILDEPMNGLDPMGRAEFGDVLRDVVKDGASVVISSHILQDLEALCREFILLRWGRMPSNSNALANAREATESVPGSSEVAPPSLPPLRWPAVTKIRCAAPGEMAQFLMSRGLLKGCDLDARTQTLTARWNDPAQFYGDYQTLLIESGIEIFDVSAAGSHLEAALEPPPLP
ncbi:ABC transporter ATP-binding protein [Opitutaceae bacterium]|nr:ABC transporter ATP-binding protein [Opitutaceae bacterium]